MSDSIRVRVTRDSYDMASTGRQTQVYVQIPEVARTSWLLSSDLFDRLKDRAWPEVLDVVHDYVTYGGVASNSSATAAWAAVRMWLEEAANRDEMQAAFEEHEARRHPVARKLLVENGRLRTEVAALRDERHSTNEALDDVAKALKANRGRIAELEAAPKTVYRASHDSIVMGLYTTAAEARKHCETVVRREYEDAEATVKLWWREDEDTVDKPEDGEQELIEYVNSKVVPGPGLTRPTGYRVSPLEVAASYDEEADQ